MSIRSGVELSSTLIRKIFCRLPEIALLQLDPDELALELDRADALTADPGER